MRVLGAQFFGHMNDSSKRAGLKSAECANGEEGLARRVRGVADSLNETYGSCVEIVHHDETEDAEKCVLTHLEGAAIFIATTLT